MTQQNDDFLMDAQITLSDLEGSANPILQRVKNRLLNEVSGENKSSSHSSHSSSSGRGHTSFVTGRFEDQPSTVEKK